MDNDTMYEAVRLAVAHPERPLVVTVAALLVGLSIADSLDTIANHLDTIAASTSEGAHRGYRT